MSDNFPNYYQNKMWLNNVYSDQNFQAHTPFAFNGYNYSTNPFVINGHVPDRHCQQTNNLHAGIWGRDNAKTYFRLHGGIGDGLGGIASRNTYENVVVRPVQLFDALNMVDFQVNVPKKLPVAPMQAMGGTGVFLPVYPKKNCDTIGYCGGRGRMKGKDIAGRGRMKGKDIANKPFMSNDAMIVKEEEPKDIDEEIPIELLLPAEWTY